jgi:hypothetical protein
LTAKDTVQETIEEVEAGQTIILKTILVLMNY